MSTSRQGSAGNVVAAIASFFVPGLGQLAQGRPLSGILLFLFAAALWLVLLGWIIGFIAAYDAATFKPYQEPEAEPGPAVQQQKKITRYNTNQKTNLAPRCNNCGDYVDPADSRCDVCGTSLK